MVTELKHTALVEARDVLQGRFSGSSVSKNDRDVISFTTGNGMRFPNYLSSDFFDVSKLHLYGFQSENSDIIKLLASHFGQSETPGCITLGVGDGMQSYLRAFASGHDAILVTNGVYHSVLAWAYSLGVKVFSLSIRDKTTGMIGSESLSVDEIPRLLKSFNRVHFIVTDPLISGDVIPKSLINVLSKMSNHRVTVLYDRVFWGTEETKVIRPDLSANEVAFYSFTKSHCLSALPLGVAFGSEAHIAGIQDAISKTRGRRFSVNIDAAIAAITRGSQFVLENRMEMAKRRRAAIELLASCSALKIIGKPTAAHSIIINLSRRRNSRRFSSVSVEHVYGLLHHACIAVSPAITNGERDGLLRLNIADIGEHFHSTMDLPLAFQRGRQLMEEGLRRLIRYVEV